MKKHRVPLRYVIDALPFEVQTGWLNQQKERTINVLARPVMWLGVVSYVLAMWLLERNDEAVR
jgi:hypothetical protein